VQSLGRQAIITITASPLGEEEPGPEGAERGGYLPIPRRDARAEVRGTGDASAELHLATAARATGRERVTERQEWGEQRGTWCDSTM